MSPTNVVIAMKYRQHIRLQFLTSAVIEMCWLFACANLIMGLLSDHPFPYREAIIAFGLATMLTHLTDGRGWRRVSKFVLHIFGFIFVSFLLLYASIYPSLPFFSRAWLISLFSLPETIMDSIILVVTVLWALVFWINGMKLARRPMSYWSVCRRFDFGILMFSGLLLFKIGLIQNEIPMKEQITDWMMITFFLFGLMAMGLARNRRQARTTYLAGYRTFGVLLSFALLVLIVGISLSSLLWPFWVATAEVGDDILQQGLQALTPMLAGTLKRFFRGSMDSGTESLLNDNDTIMGGILSGNGVGEKGFLEVILWWGFGSLIVLTVLGLAAFALWHLVRWLFSTPHTDKERPHRLALFMAWLFELPGILLFCWDWLSHRLRRNNNVTQVYAALLCWGKHSGVRHGQNETPLEYGLRLSGNFPIVQAEIALISDLFQQETYAEQILDLEQFKQANLALQRLRSPFYWPIRLYSRFRSAELEKLR